MHRSARCLGLVALLAGPARVVAQSAPRVSADSAARSLIKLEDAWAAALVKRDGATFQRLLAPRFVYTENDRLMQRADVIRDVVSGTDTARTARNEGMEVHLFGSTGVVTGWLIVGGRGAGGPFDHRYRFTDTWVRGEQGWQIVAAQDYLAPVKTR